MQDQLNELARVQHEHGIRFANGREVMAEMKADIASLKPKAPDWVKLLMSGLAVIGVLMGAQLWLTDRFAERPKWEQVDNALRPIKDAQSSMRETVRAIEQSQMQQAAGIKAMGAKLDRLLTEPKKRAR